MNREFERKSAKERRFGYYREHKLTEEQINNSENYLKEVNKKETERRKKAREENKENKLKFKNILDEIEKEGIYKFKKITITTDGRGCYYDILKGDYPVRDYVSWEDVFSDKEFFKNNLKYII